jgi:S-adenosylmethionine hydrolase
VRGRAVPAGLRPRRRPDPPLITLLTDFGLDDVHVGVMKGVVASIAPRARVIDLTHGVAAQDLLQGGLRWAAAVPYFPRGTVHLAVVDPGVGGERPILAARWGGSIFLCPDNGLIGFILPPRRFPDEAVLVKERRYFLPEVSRTFHGRDIFAPVAARLALGLPLSRLGPPAKEFVRGALPPVREEKSAGRTRLRGEVVDIDNFGNCITNIPAALAAGGLRDIRVARLRIPAPAESYGSLPPGKPLAIFGSLGYLEIAVNRGRADRALGLRRGARVSARRI